MDQCFPKSQRILKSIEFKRTLDDGRKFVGKFFVVFGTKQEKPSRLGLIVSKKVGKAPIRNRVKRRLRSVFRQLPEDLKYGLDVVVIARFKSTCVDYADISKEFQTCLRFLKKNGS